MIELETEISWRKTWHDYISQLLSKVPLNWHYKDFRGRPYELYSNRPSSLILLNASGVYIIWYEQFGGIIKQAVYVGQGNIDQRLSAHRNDLNIIQHSINHGKLYVAYAIEPSLNEQLGIENYLHDSLNPLESNKSSNQPSIPVQLPWERISNGSIRFLN